MEDGTGAAGGAAENPRPVSRGLKLHIGFVGIDSLYLVMEYPHADIFEQWSAPITDFSDPRLHEGIPYDEMVLRRGGLGYKLSVWDGDARLFITDRVNDALEDTPSQGHGMGLMLQLGPQWLRAFGELGGLFAPNTLKRNIEAQLMVFGVEDPFAYPVRLNRLDLTVDLVGADVNELDLGRWHLGWVGYAKPKGLYFMTKTGQVEGFAVGSSQGAVRFKVYDKVAEAHKSGKTAFWRSVWGLPQDDGDAEEIPVARFEWTVKCYHAQFAHLRYLEGLTFERFVALLNYVTVKWGQLREPGEDSNPTRWALAPLWATLLNLIAEWSLHNDQLAEREYVFDPDIKAEYLRFVAGTLAGLQVRVGYEQGRDEPASLAQVLSFLHQEGHSIPELDEKARQKWAVFSRLARRSGT